MSPSERLSIYLPDRLRRIIDIDAEQTPGLSNRIAAIVDRYGVIITECPAFRRSEWLLMLDACNGWASWSEAGETLMVGLAAEVEDHIRLNDAGAHWQINSADCQVLVARLAGLSRAETMAVLERIERFWRRPAADADAAMQEAGICPAS